MAFNPSDPLKVYPGSPVLAQHWMRPQDRLVACEREPATARTLALRLRGDRRSKAVAIDGYMALNAYVPPKERRGVVLVDPPFEAPDEFDRLAQALIGACRKWPAGIYALWYPIKDTGQTEAFARGLVQAGLARILRAELTLPGRGDERLHGCGLILVNPPWRLDSELVVMLPALAEVLAGGAERGAGTRIGWLAGEK
jgi:23S rRNA (adenine2030-N6)-methyltransferase